MASLRSPHTDPSSSFGLFNKQGGQAIYTFVTLLIPVFVLYDSKFWCSTYLIALFAISAWNGASFYSESWGGPRANRKCTRAISKLIHLFTAAPLR